MRSNLITTLSPYTTITYMYKVCNQCLVIILKICHATIFNSYRKLLKGAVLCHNGAYFLFHMGTTQAQTNLHICSLIKTFAVHNKHVQTLKNLMIHKKSPECCVLPWACCHNAVSMPHELVELNQKTRQKFTLQMPEMQYLHITPTSPIQDKYKD